MKLELRPGLLVRHGEFGRGTVRYVDADTAGVRFDSVIHEVRVGELTVLHDPADKIAGGRWDDFDRTLARAQGELIRSVHGSWGVFAPSKIQLLPHQLWVCKRVIERWPSSWLIADDVGLGKTIEAGLVLGPLLASGDAKRALILSPASLVPQWADRMFEMFDLRFQEFNRETARSDGFWRGDVSQIVASLQTLRADHTPRAKKQQEAFLDSPAWDIVIVDEAHHLNAREDGRTLGYRLLNEMRERDKIRSLVLFTATPHRGKDYGFWSLMRLVDPRQFDPRLASEAQLPKLRSYMIRNSKETVTSLDGVRLFQRPEVQADTYGYQPEEEAFYRRMTEFIAEGRAYARTLDEHSERTATLVLFALQKLASSSVAAVRRALARRKTKLQEGDQKRSRTRTDDVSEPETLDEAAEIEEQRPVEDTQSLLARDEIAALDELLRLATEVTSESKIERILRFVREEAPDRSVLFFTEYKATQSLLLSALAHEYGDEAVSFINGDGTAEGILRSDGEVYSLRTTRQQAARDFNEGRVRFLVSTEAAGEGIDLQERCHTLVHVDLPWNPMRLHQRVGRLYRYGQKSRVEVRIFRNPDTIEAEIWALLDEKIQRIEKALAAVAEGEPEDLMPVVLGMTSPRVFDDLFAGAAEAAPGTRRAWFDEQTKTFGGQDVLDTVLKLQGRCDRFDFGTASSRLPRLDLDALLPFLERAVRLGGRTITHFDDGTFTLRVPDTWRQTPADRPNERYEHVTLDRAIAKRVGTRNVLGAGHRAVEAALWDVERWTEAVTMVPIAPCSNALVLVRVRDRLTGTNVRIHAITVAVEIDVSTGALLARLPDWQALERVNAWKVTPSVFARLIPAGDPGQRQRVGSTAVEHVLSHVAELDVPYQQPEAEVVTIFWPALASTDPPGPGGDVHARGALRG